MMERYFRSRGFRIITVANQTYCQEKIYYEPDESCHISNETINQLQEQGLISLFEYSMVEDGIDTYNFHVSLLNREHKKIYIHLPEGTTEVFSKIQNCFGDCMRNYTIGWKLNGTQIENESFYFYPTVLIENQYRIRGITNQERITDGLKRFSSMFFTNDIVCQKEIIGFSNDMHKFKGISVHVSKGITGFKIYGRIKADKLRYYLPDRYGYLLNETSQYGECVLAALRISSGKIQGYNVYFLR